MMVLIKGALLLVCLGAVALAIPLSLLEDVKEMRLKTPVRSNKVKRAQEVIMFGNQQNRGTETRGYSFPRNEKRAADMEDNSLSDVPSLPYVLPQVEENGFDTNQLDGRTSSYLYFPGEPLYNLQLRNAFREQQLYNDPAYNDLGLYNFVDSRLKREAKILQRQLRNKRELEYNPASTFNPEDIYLLPKFLEEERQNKLHEWRMNWPKNSMDTEDYDVVDNQSDNDVESAPEYLQNGYWFDGPVTQHHNLESPWPRQHKRFMVTKRRMVDDQSSPGQVPLVRRFLL